LRVEYTASLEAFGGHGATTFQLWVQNTSGGSFGFRNFRVHNAAYTPDPSGFGSGLLGQDSCSGCTEHDLGGADTESWGHWAIDGWPTAFGTPTFSFSRHFYEPIFGCDRPDAFAYGAATTCNGMVRVDDFFLPGRWEVTAESRFLINGAYYDSDDAADEGWTWDPVDCYIGETCVAVPEPGSLPLIAMGLMLVGLAGWRRRFN
jgi:hypothetical protein